MTPEELARHLANLRHRQLVDRAAYLNELERTHGSATKQHVLDAFGAEWRERKQAESDVLKGIKPW